MKLGEGFSFFEEGVLNEEVKYYKDVKYYN